MERNIFIQMSKLHNLKGRINYISSFARQENLYAVYETVDKAYWSRLAKENQIDFEKSNTSGTCIEARELIIALPESFQQYEPNEVLKDYTDYFKSLYGVECISALHHNKRKTNYHIHLIFSERKELAEPIRKIATRNMFYDESGKRVRTKKEILDQAGNLKKGCRIIKKGEAYEVRKFEKKDTKFKSKAFLTEVKEVYAEKMNEKLADSRYRMNVFDKKSPYLAMRKIGKNNPKSKEIRENNKQRLRWNRSINKALNNKISIELLIAVKKNEVIFPIKEAVKMHGSATDMIMKIIDRAVSTLNRFVNRLIRYGIANEIKPDTDSFIKALNECRGNFRTRNNKEWER